MMMGLLLGHTGTLTQHMFDIGCEGGMTEDTWRRGGGGGRGGEGEEKEEGEGEREEEEGEEEGKAEGEGEEEEGEGKGEGERERGFQCVAVLASWRISATTFPRMRSSVVQTTPEGL